MACAGATWSRSSSTRRAGSRGGPRELWEQQAPPCSRAPLDCCFARRRRQYCQGLVDYDQVRAATPQMFAAELTGLKQDQARLQSAEKEVEKTLALVTKLCG